MRRLFKSFFWGGLFLGAQLGFAAPNISVSTTFTSADPARTNSYMDIGGVWNGSSDVTSTTGDTFNASFSNASGADTAFDIVLGVVLPAGFNFTGAFSSSFSGAGCPGTLPTLSASQVASNIEVSFSPVGFDLPSDCMVSLDYGLTTTNTVTGGSYSVQPFYDFSLTEGGALEGVVNAAQEILVRQGASALSSSPVIQTLQFSETGNFKSTVCNTGFGGLFNVETNLTYSSLNPETLVQNTTDTDASTVPMTGGDPSVSIPYLEPGKCFVVDVGASVNGCTAISIDFSTNDKTGSTSASFLSSVILDLETPLLDYTAVNISVPGDGSSSSVSIPISNTAAGSAFNVVIDSDLNSYNTIVENLASGWTYNDSNGSFSYSSEFTAAPNTINLTFDVRKPLTCSARGSQTGVLVWTTSYEDGCSNTFSTPVGLSDISVSETTDPFSLGKDGVPGRVLTGSTQTWTLRYTPGLTSTIVDPVDQSILITDSLPANVDSITVKAPSAGSVTCVPATCAPGSLVQWNLDSTQALSVQTLEIEFDVPSDGCQAGTSITNTATSTVDFLEAGCSFTADAESSTDVAHSDGASDPLYFVAGSTGGVFETGKDADADHATHTLAVSDKDEGEGDFLEFTNRFEAGSSAGTWAGSVFRDDFAGLSTQKLVPLTGGNFSVEYQLNDSGSWIQFPSGNVVISSGSLELDLSVVDGGGSVTGDTLDI